MWISLKEYKRLNGLEAKYYDTARYIDSLVCQMDMYRKDRAKYREQCEEYKRKYADEVNKRLELINFYEERNA